MLIRESRSNSLSLAAINEFDKGSLTQNSKLLGHVYHVGCWRVPRKGTFRHLSDYVFGVRNFETTKSMRVVFFLKYLKLQLDLKNAAKNSENVFCWLNNCMRIGIVKLSLLRTGYFSSAANVLTSSPKISHVNQRDFFQINWLGSDKLIW